MTKGFRKRIGLLIVSLLVTSMSVLSFADVETQQVITTKLEKTDFEVTYEEDKATISFDSNASTGYQWVYEIEDEKIVEFINAEYINSDDNLVGAPGKETFTFEMKEDGVTVITFSYKRAWEENAINEVRILAYKSGKTVIFEEDQVVTIAEEVKMNDLTGAKVLVNDVEVELDVDINVIDGVNMIPLSGVLRELGYEVKWNADTSSVDILKGPKWTTIKIGENAYFKNRMAASPLSAAPIIIKGRTLVPAEFFTVVLDLGLAINANEFNINENEMVINSGIIQEIYEDENGVRQITIAQEANSSDVNSMLVINISNESTIFNTEFKVGDHINVICSMMTTMSIPPQTPGYIIY